MDMKGTNRSNFVDSQDTLHSNGFAYPSKLIDELDANNWREFDGRTVAQILALGTIENNDLTIFGELEFPNLTISAVSGPNDWTSVDSVGGVFLPEASLDAISRWICA